MERTLKKAGVGETPLVGSWIALAHPEVAEMIAHLGYDFLAIDREHTAISLETLENVLRAVDAAPGDSETLVRVPGDDPVELKRVLDLGPDGVMVPMVETAAQAEAIVEATRYPPDGVRGVGLHRAADYGLALDGYVRTADETLARFVQIETERGVENAEEIAAVDGVDGVFVGPVDLSASLDAFGDYDAERFERAVDRIVRAADATDVAVGTLATSEDEREARLGWGVDFLIAGVDSVHLLDGAVDTKRHCEQIIESMTE
ncbi:HpcH/HpaI aldolase family protein [Halegenticoccus soli]|uniref:HpcH/HpaI aldolase family protein n=1 Tax=Halegenticoccus soli TaxID=1985678 RepID=UPI000C6DE513|nr:aldolase/citrate lyase family protein [Halegenticoccus soli]